MSEQINNQQEEKGLFLDAAKELIESTIFWTHKDNPFRASIEIGDPRVVCVVGDNASGKSFFVDTVRTIAKDMCKDVSTVSISIRERTGSGLDEMAGMRRSMMFGNESEQSTGATSAGMISKGFSNLLSRIEDGKRVLLVLDEPELGLAETFHRAVGELIAQESKALPKDADFSVVVVSHSRKLIHGLTQALGSTPTAAILGKHSSLKAWAEDNQDKSVEDLLNLRQEGHASFKKVSALFDTIKKMKKTKSPEM